MIKAYLAGISVFQEGEDIEVRYAIYKDDVLILKKREFLDYRKPLVVGQVSLITLLNAMEAYKGQEITIIINDGALNEQIRGTYVMKNGELIKLSGITNSKLKKFGDNISVKCINNDKDAISEWNEILSFKEDN